MILCQPSNLSVLANQIAGLIGSYKKYKVRNTNTFVYNIPVAFDTETTSFQIIKDIPTSDIENVAWLYIWMFRFGNPLSKKSVSIYGRDTETLDLFLTELSNYLNLIDNKTLLYVYVHNLGFDLEFIRDKLHIIKQLNSEPHKPITIRDSRNIEFRDSYILANKSLARIGKEDLKNGLEKKLGDLDYTKIRCSTTPLTDIELGYCQGDIDVLASYITGQIQQYKGIQYIPMTNTGRVRKYCREKIYHDNSYGSILRYMGLMKECVLTTDEYLECNKAYYGGFTHANIKYVGKTLKNVVSYDFTSSYPAVMLSERYPMGKPTHFDTMTFDELKTIINDVTKKCVFEVQLSNVFIKDDIGDCYISGDCSKTRIENPVMNNGRIKSCDKIAFTITDVDFKIINQCYDWDDIYISNVLVWESDYLPTQLIGITLDLYKKKTELKGIEDREQEYNNSKEMLNSLYGMCVTRILRDEIELIDDNWVKTQLSDEDKIKNIEKNNNSKTRFLYYPWGVYISAYARFNLWTAIKTLGNDYIYSDTDSIKVFANSKKLDEYLKKYQSDLDFKFQMMLETRRKFKIDDLKPKTIKGVSKPLGVWEYEGKFTYYKTLGAKRYIRYNDEKGLKSTVAGISPYHLSKYLLETTNNDIPKCFELFKNGLTVPANKTGKLEHTYCSNVHLTVTDCYNNKCIVNQKYGVSLNPTPFTLTMDDTFLNLIKILQGAL